MSSRREQLNADWFCRRKCVLCERTKDSLLWHTEIRFCQVTQLCPPCLTSLKISSNKSKDQRINFALSMVKGVLTQSNMSVLHAFLVYYFSHPSIHPPIHFLCLLYQKILCLRLYVGLDCLCAYFSWVSFSLTVQRHVLYVGFLETANCKQRVCEHCRRLVTCPGSSIHSYKHTSSIAYPGFFD